MKAYFCYEKDFASRWQPRVYHNEWPSKSVNGQGPERYPKRGFEIEIKNEDDINFGQLQKLYPNPDLKKETFNVKKEMKMVRPVEGFVTFTGRFYETEEEANLDEAYRELLTTLEEQVIQFQLDPNGDHLSQITSNIIDFIKYNKLIVRDYIDALTAISAKEQSKDELVGQPTNNSTAPNPRVRKQNSDKMDDDASPEDKSSRTRNEDQSKKNRTKEKSDS